MIRLDSPAHDIDGARRAASELESKLLWRCRRTRKMYILITRR